MRYPVAVKLGARDLFVNHGWSVREISRDLGAAISTVQTWSKEVAWERERRHARAKVLAASRAGAEIVELDADWRRIIQRSLRAQSEAHARLEAFFEGRLPRKAVPFDMQDLVKSACMIAAYFELVQPAKLRAEIRALRELDRDE